MDLLLVDDHAEVRHSIAAFLEEFGHRIHHAVDGRAALVESARVHPDLILADLRMPGMTGLELLQALEELDDPPPLALMTAFGDTQTAVEAMRLGAVDYLRKPIDVKELHALVERIAAQCASVASTTTAREEVDGLVVQGDELRRLVALADRLHDADLPCLIEGETGTGKELFARRIHHGGSRPRGPFIALNCAAIATGLFESELFGYVAGAFTGAVSGGNAGKLAAAEDGTLFLDEIGDLPLDQQAKLLRLLEERTWYPVGSQKLMRLTARVVCATNAGLLERVRSGRFREDLYYRMKVGHLRLPPLRERADTIVPLALVFLARIRKQRGRGFQKLSSDAEALLRSFPWPGNVRQLLHLLEQACLMFDGAVLGADHIRQLLPEAAAAVPTATQATVPGESIIAPSELNLPVDSFDLDGWQRAVVAAALKRHDGSPVRTAAYLKVSRKVLYTLRKRYGLLD
ncbi:MAG: sigma-54-dependent Fis family transcriptional regulator [Planctomycetes bacterium]|nr:sigma-54-dependent Fis family transcriptional regulator [Planctomycetota bacterium]